MFSGQEDSLYRLNTHEQELMNRMGVLESENRYLRQQNDSGWKNFLMQATMALTLGAVTFSLLSGAISLAIFTAKCIAAAAIAVGATYIASSIYSKACSIYLNFQTPQGKQEKPENTTIYQRLMPLFTWSEKIADYFRPSLLIKMGSAIGSYFSSKSSQEERLATEIAAPSQPVVPTIYPAANHSQLGQVISPFDPGYDHDAGIAFNQANMRTSVTAIGLWKNRISITTTDNQAEGLVHSRDNALSK